MKGYNLFIACLSSLLLGFLPDAEAAASGNKINWITNYDQALNESKSSSKPIVLFFTGSDWCGWCKKLQKEVLDTPEFANAVADQLIFVELDFPMKKRLDAQTTQKNDKLKKKFSVRSFPSIVLTDANQQPIGVTGYRSGGGQKYAQHLIKMVKEFTTYRQQMRRLSSHKFSGKELKRLYQKAQELGLHNDANLLIRIGMDSDLSHFFLAQRYRFLVNAGNIHSDEAISVKQQLFKTDPDNQHLTHYEVAVVDFEALNEEMERKKITVDDAVLPLVNYINQYGSQDNENLWRLNMVISQVYLEKNQLKNALRFAENSHTAAPPSIQQELALAIENIQHQISKEN